MYGNFYPPDMVTITRKDHERLMLRDGEWKSKLLLMERTYEEQVLSIMETIKDERIIMDNMLKMEKRSRLHYVMIGVAIGAFLCSVILESIKH